MSIARPNAETEILDISAERILLLDGAMGTMVQRLKLSEADFRGARFKDWPRDVRGNNDLLVLTLPDEIEAIHRVYFEAGAAAGQQPEPIGRRSHVRAGGAPLELGQPAAL